jgi:ATP-dependent DNA helicase DinG
LSLDRKNLVTFDFFEFKTYRDLSLEEWWTGWGVPYPSLADRWINEKRKRNEQWYSWQTGLRLVQAYGRSVRSKDDWATTYVLDSAFGNFVVRNKQILPEWFTNAISS